MMIQLNVPSRPISSSALSSDIPPEHLVVRLIERHSVRDLEARDRATGIAHDPARHITRRFVARPDRRRRIRPCLLGEECLGLNEERPLRIGPGPKRAEESAGHEDAANLVERRYRIHPVPRRGCHHDVNAAVRQRHRLATALQSADARDLLDEYRPHAIVGLDRHHLSSPVDQQSRQRAGPCAEVNDPLHR